ncbi:hypothetical protein CYMTET_27814 [Cymbomonas tetramitiformis]|uniref:Carnosine N-methyltransferase n=1 Tax=Cymbomonas tetramitiformis TaxID=36881 RepID=A0AAE0FNZ1_9CHLO|nr:hypothetical protein CYMTET_27814 [Cymbomonas tetramitiformis]
MKSAPQTHGDEHYYDADDPAYQDHGHMCHTSQEEHGHTCHISREEQEEEERLLREEQEALQRIVTAYRNYETDALEEVFRWEKNFSRLPPKYRKLVPEQPSKFAAVKVCMRANANFISGMLSNFENSRAPSHLKVVPAGGEGPGDQNVTRPGDVEKVRYVLKNILRDWSEEGAFEREQCYNPLIEELERLLPVDVTSPSTCSPTVMVPGAGLGRLCVEIASRGYSAQRCAEFSAIELFSDHKHKQYSIQLHYANFVSGDT